MNRECRNLFAQMMMAVRVSPAPIIEQRTAIASGFAPISGFTAFEDCGLDNAEGVDYVKVTWDSFNINLATTKPSDGWYFVVAFGGFIPWGNKSHPARCLTHYSPSLGKIRIQMPFACDPNGGERNAARWQLNDVSAFNSIKISANGVYLDDVLLPNTTIHDWGIGEDYTTVNGMLDATEEEKAMMVSRWNTLIAYNPLRVGFRSGEKGAFVNRQIEVGFKTE